MVYEMPSKQTGTKQYSKSPLTYPTGFDLQELKLRKPVGQFKRLYMYYTYNAKITSY